MCIIPGPKEYPRAKELYSRTRGDFVSGTLDLHDLFTNFAILSKRCFGVVIIWEESALHAYSVDDVCVRE